ncbi:MAG: FtsX-like permease family protein, partial [Gemmatimonadetes bacterium]|nr:FtsX-like permease family protein [Gemmatimonadota bacterium]
FTLSPSLNGYEPAESRILFDELEERLGALPGVADVTSSRVSILSGNSWGNDVSVEGYEWEPGMDANSRYNEVGPGFFSTMGIPLLAGREFTQADAEGTPKVAVINETFARNFGLDPRTAVGARMKRGTGDGDLDMEIVGIVRDARYSDVKDDVPPVFAIPHRQSEGLGDLNFYVRLAADGEQVVPRIRETVAALDPNLPIDRLRMLEQQIDETLAVDRLIGTLSGSFALLATLLAAVGLYGVLSFTVARRTREIGIRMALGAETGSVRSMVLRQVLVMTVMGGALGLGAAWFLSGLAESLLFGVEGVGVAIVLGTIAAIAAVTMTAGYLPARRASHVDPVVALRSE